jgi:hypothetical protein
MSKVELLQQAARNAGFDDIVKLVSHKGKPSRVIELLKNPTFNPDNQVETSLLFNVLPDDMKAQISSMPTEELKVACAAYLADDLPAVVEFLP